MVIDELIAILGYDVRGEENLRRFNKGMDDAAKKAAAIAAAVGKWAAIAGAAVAGGLSILGKGVIETSAAFESYETTLETIEGSAEKAKKAMAWVSDFAVKTPYDIDGVTEAFVKLKAYGIDPTDGSMEVIGNTASAMGKGLMQAVEAWADAMTGEFERLKEFGIKAKQEKDKVTFTWNEGGKEMSKTVSKTGRDIQNFLNETFGRKFQGAMDRQSKTWKGLWSNLEDVWVSFKRKIGDAGLFDVAKRKLQDLLDTLGRWEDDGTLAKIAKAFSDAFTSIANIIGLIINRIGTHVATLNRNWEVLAPWLKAIGAALAVVVAAAFPVVTAILLLSVAVDDLLTYMGGGESIFGAWIDWLKEMTGLSQGAAASITGLGAALVAALGLGLLFKPGAFLKLGAKVASVFVGGFLRAGLWLMRVAWAALAGFVEGLIEGLVLLVRGVISAGGLSALFRAGLAVLGTAGFWAALGVAAGAALIWWFWDDIQAAFPILVANIQSLFSDVATAFNTDGFFAAGMLLSQRLWEGTIAGGGAAIAWIGNTLAWIRGAIVGFDWGGVGQILVAKLLAGMKSAGLSLAAPGTRLAATIIAFDWLGVGAAIGTFIWEGVKSAADAAYSIGAWLADQLTNQNWVDVGKSIISSIWDGMKSIGAGLRDWFGGLFAGDSAAAGEGRKAGATASDAIKGWLTGAPVQQQSSVGSGRKPEMLTDPSDSRGQTGPTKTGAASAGPSWQEMYQNLKANAAKTGESAAMAAVTNDNRVTNNNIEVSAPITMNVQQAVQAPAAIAGQVKGAVEQGAAAVPTRMQAGPVQ